MEYDSIRKRPTSRGPHLVLAVAALLGGSAALFVNGYSFAPLTDRTYLGLYGSGSDVWVSQNESQVPVEWWVRIGALVAIYPWQLLWVSYCIFQLALKVVNVSVPCNVLVAYIVASALDVGLVYAAAWAGHNKLSAVPLVLSALLFAALCGAVAMSAHHLYAIAPDINPRSRWFGWAVVLNGLVAYATWAAIDCLLDLDDVVLTYYVSASSSSAMVVLILTAFFSTVYFVLECTLLDRYLRGVFAVYPVVLWTASGIHASQQDFQATNYTLSLALLVGSCGMLVLRVVLQVAFSLFRPLPRYHPNYILK